MKNFLSKYKVDIIVILVLFVISLAGVLSFFYLGKKEEVYAYIYVENELVEKIDLSKESETPRNLTLKGKNDYFTVEIKYNDIKIIENTCFNKTCIKQGSATTLKPIICTYNEVYIELLGKENIDVELG